MPYCSSVPGFAGFEEPEVEVDSEDITEDTVNVSVRVVRNCTGCGQEQAELTLEFEMPFEHQCADITDRLENGEARDAALALDPDEGESMEFELESVDVDPVDEYQTKDRHGKPIKSSRYMKHLLGASITANIRCTRCQETFDVTDSQSEAASSFDDQGSH